LIPITFPSFSVKTVTDIFNAHGFFYKLLKKALQAGKRGMEDGG
jgi:hypothetical protein